MLADKNPLLAIGLFCLVHEHVNVSDAGRVEVKLVLCERLWRIPRACLVSACAKPPLDELTVALAQVKALGDPLYPRRRDNQLKLVIVRRENARPKSVCDNRRVHDRNIRRNRFAKYPSVIDWVVALNKLRWGGLDVRPAARKHGGKHHQGKCAI